MSINNTPKPEQSSDEYHFLIGGTFRLILGGVYRLLISPEILTGEMNNLPRVATGLTWNTITTTWATEPKTWDEAISDITNTSKPSAGTMTNTPKPS